MFSAHTVSKRFRDGAIAIDTLTLAVRPHETLALVGPSGCGKSTLLRLFLGLLPPDSGEIHFEGRPVPTAEREALLRRIGYVVQDGGLFPHLTVRENVTLVARWLRRPAAEIAERCDKLSQQVKLAPHYLDRYPSQLSGGQRQRAALLRALFLDPTVLLLDEPLGALDPIVRRDLQEELRELFRSLKKTVVLVTHDLAEAAFFADRIGLLRRGQLLQLGTLADLRDRPADEFVTRFLAAHRPFAFLETP